MNPLITGIRYFEGRYIVCAAPRIIDAIEDLEGEINVES